MADGDIGTLHLLHKISNFSWQRREFDFAGLVLRDISKIRGKKKGKD